MAGDSDPQIDPVLADTIYRALVGRPATREELSKYPTLRASLHHLSGSFEHCRRLYATIGHAFFYGDMSNRVDVDVEAATLSEMLRRVGVSWTALGTTTPHFSVMTNPRYLPSELTPELEEEFYKTGLMDVTAVQKRLTRLGAAPPSKARVLDFGCGLGRLGQHLSASYGSYCGVDISPPHLAYAEARFAGLGRRNIRLLPVDQFLSWTPGEQRFELVVSLLTLQHNPPPVIGHLFRGLLASLAPGGVAYIQVPTYLHDYAFNAADYMAQPRPIGEMEMHAFPMERAFAIVREEACDVLEVVTDGRVGSLGVSTGFVLRRPPQSGAARAPNLFERLRLLSGWATPRS